jgi:hypothetical protein
MIRYPEITYDDGYIEVPDDTALWLLPAPGRSRRMAYDHAHFDCVGEGKLEMKQTQQDAGDSVTWHEERTRPIMPLIPVPLQHADGVKE